MKKLLIIAATAMMIIVLSACPSTGSVQTPAVQTGLPSFVLNPPLAEDAIYGVGWANLTNQSTSLEVAKTRGRADVARQIEVQIQGALTDYFQEGGDGIDDQTIQFIESVTRELVDQKLQGARTKEVAPMEDGSFWVLIEYSLTKFKDDFVDTAEFVREGDAAFAEFKAQEALKFLDSQLNNNPTQANPVSE